MSTVFLRLLAGVASQSPKLIRVSRKAASRLKRTKNLVDKNFGFHDSSPEVIDKLYKNFKKTKKELDNVRANPKLNGKKERILADKAYELNDESKLLDDLKNMGPPKYFGSKAKKAGQLKEEGVSSVSDVLVSKLIVNKQNNNLWIHRNPDERFQFGSTVRFNKKREAARKARQAEAEKIAAIAKRGAEQERIERGQLRGDLPDYIVNPKEVLYRPTTKPGTTTEVQETTKDLFDELGDIFRPEQLPEVGSFQALPGGKYGIRPIVGRKTEPWQQQSEAIVNLGRVQKKPGVEKIISGGQTGVDQSGLKAAQEIGVKTGGFAPKGYKIDTKTKGKALFDSKELKELGLTELPSKDYKVRTGMNIYGSDGTVIFGDIKSAGTQQTINILNEGKKAGWKPYVINPSPEELAAWINKHDISTLNVAGNRATPEGLKHAATAEDVLKKGISIQRESEFTDIAGAKALPESTPQEFPEGTLPFKKIGERERSVAEDRMNPDIAFLKLYFQEQKKRDVKSREIQSYWDNLVQGRSKKKIIEDQRRARKLAKSRGEPRPIEEIKFLPAGEGRAPDAFWQDKGMIEATKRFLNIKSAPPPSSYSRMVEEHSVEDVIRELLREGYQAEQIGKLLESAGALPPARMSVSANLERTKPILLSKSLQAIDKAGSIVRPAVIKAARRTRKKGEPAVRTQEEPPVTVKRTKKVKDKGIKKRIKDGQYEWDLGKSTKQKKSKGVPLNLKKAIEELADTRAKFKATPEDEAKFIQPPAKGSEHLQYKKKILRELEHAVQQRAKIGASKLEQQRIQRGEKEISPSQRKDLGPIQKELIKKGEVVPKKVYISKYTNTLRSDIPKIDSIFKRIRKINEKENTKNYRWTKTDKKEIKELNEDIVKYQLERTRPNLKNPRKHDSPRLKKHGGKITPRVEHRGTGAALKGFGKATYSNRLY
tara:strand:+ start:47 stop:2863 length:2817 start_codon:yes stop_codon:yes gene_type:complete